MTSVPLSELRRSNYSPCVCWVSSNKAKMWQQKEKRRSRNVLIVVYSLCPVISVQRLLRPVMISKKRCTGYATWYPIMHWSDPAENEAEPELQTQRHGRDQCESMSGIHRFSSTVERMPCKQDKLKYLNAHFCWFNQFYDRDNYL